jgi:hypothetical protein
MAAGGFERATSVVVEGARHDVGDSHDNLLRELLAAFLRDPGCFSSATLKGLKYGQCSAAGRLRQQGSRGEGVEGDGDGDGVADVDGAGAGEAPGQPEQVLCEGQAEQQQDAGGWEEKLASSCRALPIGQGCSDGTGGGGGSGKLRYGLARGRMRRYGRPSILGSGWSLAQMGLLALCLLMLALALSRLRGGGSGGGGGGVGGGSGGGGGGNGAGPPRPTSPSARRNAAVLKSVLASRGL